MCQDFSGTSLRSLFQFTDSIYTVYTGDKPKTNVNSDVQIVQLPCWLLSLAWKPIEDKHLDLFLKLWLCQHPKPVQLPFGGARPQRLQRDARIASAEVARARAASAAGILMVVW